MGIYHIVIWFFLCSLLGYLLECVVLSAEHKTPVLNRGFGHGPFCIIYGFGALGASILLKPVSDSYVELYLASMIMATLMELFTASVMIHLFGSFWWDYSEKPFNFKGDHLPGEQSWLGFSWHCLLWIFKWISSSSGWSGSGKPGKRTGYEPSGLLYF